MVKMVKTRINLTINVKTKDRAKLIFGTTESISAFVEEALEREIAWRLSK